MKKQIGKLLGFAKTLGKHLWDQNKNKIIKKGFKILKSGRGETSTALLNLA